MLRRASAIERTPRGVGVSRTPKVRQLCTVIGSGAREHRTCSRSQSCKETQICVELRSVGTIRTVSSSSLRERKKDRTRATITRVALELFARDGFHATTINDIAEAAEVA